MGWLLIFPLWHASLTLFFDPKFITIIQLIFDFSYRRWMFFCLVKLKWTTHTNKEIKNCPLCWFLIADCWFSIVNCLQLIVMIVDLLMSSMDCQFSMVDLELRIVHCWLSIVDCWLLVLLSYCWLFHCFIRWVFDCRLYIVDCLILDC